MVGDPVSVLVVDDQNVFRDVLAEVVRATPGMSLAGAMASGEEALGAAEELVPALVLMDKRMPGMGGIVAGRALVDRHPGIVVVLVSVEEVDAATLTESGAAAYLPKRELSPAALRAVWEVHGRVS